MSKRFIPIKPAEIVWKQGVPFAQAYNDVYFSIESGIKEARHVFIDGNQLIPRWKALNEHASTHFVIAETGFGTGLNFLLACSLWLLHAPKSCCLHYYSCELNPLTKNDLQKCLALWPELSELAFELISQYPTLTPGFHTISVQG